MSFPIEMINLYDKPFSPKKAGDVGHDLYVDIGLRKMSLADRLASWLKKNPSVVIWPFQSKMVGSGIYVSQPDSVWCQITARSSAMKRGLMVIGGIIDSGYQGELFTILYNMTLRPRIVQQGERYSQVLFFDAVRPRFRKVFQFAKQSDRGDTGFGSSGQ